MGTLHATPSQPMRHVLSQPDYFQTLQPAWRLTSVPCRGRKEIRLMDANIPDIHPNTKLHPPIHPKPAPLLLRLLCAINPCVSFSPLVAAEQHTTQSPARRRSSRFRREGAIEAARISVSSTADELKGQLHASFSRNPVVFVTAGVTTLNNELRSSRVCRCLGFPLMRDLRTRVVFLSSYPSPHV